MKISMLLGVLLIVFGLGAAVMGIATVGDQPTIAADSGQTPTSGSPSFAVPVISGLSLAIGGLLVGLSMGNWRNPRSHSEPGDEVVDPEGHDKMKHV